MTFTEAVLGPGYDLPFGPVNISVVKARGNSNRGTMQVSNGMQGNLFLVQGSDGQGQVRDVQGNSF